eukprot:TRINITY_DN5750_c0_g2_i11.p3 TRINITY_DN5750_c0_g2~~TRINITY_DN5750_c0_g2_i11.p3  ORF type:complete len:226 (+),score=-26.18 TRINITY_DN5750_c0_g2_i11:465-1142(+)
MSFVHLQFLNLVMQKILKTICGYFQFNHYEHVISIQVRLLHVCHVFKALSNSNIYASRFGRLNQSINKINILIDQQICTTLKKCKLQYFDICICTIDSYILFCNITYNVTQELYKYVKTTCVQKICIISKKYNPDYFHIIYKFRNPSLLNKNCSNNDLIRLKHWGLQTLKLQCCRVPQNNKVIYNKTQYEIVEHPPVPQQIKIIGIFCLDICAYQNRYIILDNPK